MYVCVCVYVFTHTTCGPPNQQCVWCVRVCVWRVRACVKCVRACCALLVTRLTVRACDSAELGLGLEFAVADGGAGITPEVSAQLFTPFFTTKAEGMGLGLSLCRTVVEQHGGVLQHSPNPPRGTVFSFTLPQA